MGNGHKSKWVEEVPDTGNKPPFFSKRKITVISILVIVILLSVWDIFIDPPAWWRFERQKDKRAILEYVEDNYPATIRKKGGKFPLQMPAGPFEHSVMFFELDGVNFDVSAWKGKITGDTYYEAKAEKYIRENFIDGFMNERGLSPKIKISFIMPQDYYGLLQKYILDDILFYRVSKYNHNTSLY